MMSRVGVLLLALALLNGCGFQLRGADRSDLPAIQLLGAAQAPATYRVVRDELELLGVSLTPSADNALSVEITDERSLRRSVATTNVIDAAEFELRLELDVLISQDVGVMPIENTLIVERVYAVDSANLAGSFEEQALLMQEMRAELARNLLRQIEVLAIPGQAR